MQVSPVVGPLLTILGDRATRTFAGHPVTTYALRINPG
jgi:hypothetical protein